MVEMKFWVRNKQTPSKTLKKQKMKLSKSQQIAILAIQKKLLFFVFKKTFKKIKTNTTTYNMCFAFLLYI